MQVVGINSSPRKNGNTDLLLSSVLKGASDGGCETVHIDLSSYEIEYCKACDTCYRTGTCVLMDEFPDVHDVILESDGIVLGSPNYINNVTARMKTLLDRMADTVHCQRLIGKYAAAVSTAGGSGAADVADYLNHSLFIMGASIVGSVGVNLSEGGEVLQKGVDRSYQLGEMLADAICKKTEYPDQQEKHAAMLERMKQLVSQRKDDWTYEYKYFVEKKWL
ncbi:MAG: flavodoxin family protein [Methanomicrobiales archaeon]|jgi:multimeric flavodoxin WrbA|nr:flavodoxin family protein [Methanomicrobiales archaeon]